jgi:hypothetical protein
MGPAAGSRCSPIFMTDCCGLAVATKKIEDCETLEQHFVELANCASVSRAKAARIKKEEEGAARGPSVPIEIPRRAPSPQANLFLQLEVAKLRRQAYLDEIARLAQYMHCLV